MTEARPQSQSERTVYVCHSTGCLSGKAADIREALEKLVAGLSLQGVTVDFTGCHGFCQQGPIVVVEPEGIFYTHVTPDDVPDIVNSHLRDGKPVRRLFYQDPVSGEFIPHYKEIDFYRKQMRIVLRNCGRINPERIDDYLASGGYQALKKALFGLTPEQIIGQVKQSGLRGRGGAGFPTGLKWELCRKSMETPKYLICNADQGDPGAFMDRSILESDPHCVIEGMIIAACAIGSSQGFIYVRAEYPLATKRLRLALEQAESRGFLGDNILNSGFGFKISIVEGAGAFVCGEETALMASIEGGRGMPRSRPPFPAESGLWGKPTNINNVKTYASVPTIIEKGSSFFARIGTEKSKGTAVFALTGKVRNSGLIEVPMGTQLQEIIFDIGGGTAKGRRFKAVQTGGPSGGCIPTKYLGLPVDYESLTATGSIMGSGGMVIMDEDTCMVDIARYFLSFTQAESCGKCVPCRLGTRRMLEILDDICHGRGKVEDIDRLLDLAESVKAGSLCALGQTAPNPVITTIKYFREEYEEHIKKRHCRAAVCTGLVHSPCSHTCPAGIDVPRYIRFIQQGKPQAALSVIREKMPFPAVCGLVCFRPCEARCRRAQLDEAVAIRLLKGFAATRGGKSWRRNIKLMPPTGKKVAVIGSGPAGLTASYYLNLLGHSVTVFEAMSEAGGAMRYGIPAYRLPKKILRAEISEIENLGVEIRTGARINTLDSLFKDGYQAVLAATGANQSARLGVPGDDSPGVVRALDFLKEVSEGKKVGPSGSVAVIGGGNTAIDASRTALRTGAKEVSILYRRTRDEMPASEAEINEAIEEGVRIQYLVAPLSIAVTDGKLALTCVRMETGSVGADGRRRVERVSGSEFPTLYDRIITAVSTYPDVPKEFELTMGDGNTIRVEPDTFATSKRGVFAAGDAVLGTSSVIEAIAMGREAAVAIDKFLGGKGDIEEQLAPPEGKVSPIEEGEEKNRLPVPKLPLLRRRRNFKQVELGYSLRLAVEEANRCLRCDLEEKEES